MAFKIGLFLSLLAVTSAGKHDIYKGNSVYGIKLRSVSDNSLLQEFEVDSRADVWNYGSTTRDAKIMVTPENREDVLKELDQEGIEYYVDLEDVAKRLEDHDKEIEEWKQSKARTGGPEPYNDYLRYDQIKAYLEGVAERHPDLVTLGKAGESFEGRDILYMKISTTNFTDLTKPVYFMEAMLHAREWVTTPVALYSIHRLVEDLRDQDRDLLEEVDWIIMPLVNPDGYEYSHTDARLWRTTRTYRPEISTACRGVDGNRNFDVNWNTTAGISHDPCSLIYIGPEAFSEAETRAVRDVLLEDVERTQVFMDIHSHGNWILFAYGNHTLPANALQIFQVASAMGAAIDTMKLDKVRHYEIGNSAMALTETSGSAQDYGQEVGVPLSYTLELPGYGYRFEVPPRFIEQINAETWAGVAASARVARAVFRASL